MKGMDLSKFKKTASDGNSSTLTHADGHVLKIAHKGLSPKMKEQLDKLPLHQAEGGPISGVRSAPTRNTNKSISSAKKAPQGPWKYCPRCGYEHPNCKCGTAEWDAAAADQQAEGNMLSAARGGQVQKFDGGGPVKPTQDMDPSSPAPVVGNDPSNLPVGTTQLDNTDSADMSGQAPAQDQVQSQPIGQPSVNPQTAQEHVAHFNQEDMAWAQDIANGHITPETYGSLFAKKDTLGKIGTIFGMLAAGAGSGLAHQPNVLMEMMNKQINNDLEAQKQSKFNAQNFLRLGQAHELQQAQIQQALAAGKLDQAQAANALADVNIKNDAHTKNRMMISLMDSMGNQTAKLPPGSPQQQAAIGALGQMHGAVTQKMQQNNEQAANDIASRAEQNYVGDTQKLKQMGLLGQEGAPALAKDREEHYIPGIGTSKVPLNSADRERVLKINNFQNLLDEASKFQFKVSPTGALSPASKAIAAQLKNDLVSSYNDVKGLNRFTSNEEELYDKIVPDIGSKLGQFTGSVSAGLERLKNSVKQKKALEYQQLGIETFNPEDEAGHKQSSPKESHNGNAGEEERIDKKTGRTVIFDSKTKKPLRWK